MSDFSFLNSIVNPQQDESATEGGFSFLNDVIPSDTDISKPPEEPADVEGKDIWDYVPDFVKAGWNNSVTGMAYQILAGESPADLKKDNLPFTEDILAGIMSIVFDIPTFVATGGLGSVAAKSAITFAGKQLIGAGAKKAIVKTAEKNILKNLAKKGVLQSATSESIKTAVQLGLHGGLAESLRQKVNKEKLDIGEILKETGKSAIMGTVLGGISGVGSELDSSVLTKTAAEATALSVVQPVLEGRSPTYDDIAHAAALSVGLRGLGAGVGKIKGLRAEREFQEKREHMKTLSESELRNLAEKEYEIQMQEHEPPVFTSKTDKFKKVQIVGSRETKKGVKVYILRKFNGTQFKQMPVGQFWAEFSKSSKPLDKKQIRNRRLAKVHTLQRKLGYDKDQIQIHKRLALEIKKAGKPLSSADFTPEELVQYQQHLEKQIKVNEIANKYKDTIIEIPIKKTMMEHLFPKTLARGLMSGEMRVSRSKEGGLLVDEMRNAGELAMSTFGGFVERLEKMGVYDLTPKEAESLADALEGKGSPSRKVKSVANKVKKFTDELYAFAKDSGLDVAKFVEKYFSRMWKKEIADVIFDDLTDAIKSETKLLRMGVDKDTAKAMNTFIAERIKNKFSNPTSQAFRSLKKSGLSNLEAFQVLYADIFGHIYRVFGNIEKSRTLKDLPDNFYERNAAIVLTKYTAKLARRAAYIKTWGKYGEGAYAKIKELAIKDPDAGRAADILFKQFTGLIEADPTKNYSGKWKKFWNNVMSFEMATKIALGTATIPNVFQTFISTLPSAGVWRTVEGIMELSDPKIRKMVIRSGATYHSVQDLLLGVDLGLSPEKLKESITAVFKDKQNAMHHVASMLANLSGFKGVNKANQMIAASTARVLVGDLYKIATKSPFKLRRSWAKAKLARLGIKDIKNKPSQRDIEHAMFRFAQETQLQKDVLKDPIIFNDPRFRPFAIFKRFQYRQAKLIKDVMKFELSKGNVLPLLELAAGGWLGGHMIAWGRDMLFRFLSGQNADDRGKKSFSELVRDFKKGNFKGLWKDAIDSYGNAGALGMFTDMFAAEDPYRTARFIVNPVVADDMAKILYAGERLINDSKDYGLGWAMQRSIKNFSPIFGSLPRQYAKRFRTEGQRTREEKTAKGRKKSKIFEALMKGNYNEAQRLVRQWNKAFPYNPITYQDINTKTIYRHALNKYGKKP